MVKRRKNYQQKPIEAFNPFEAKQDFKGMVATLNKIDDKELRGKFKSTQEDAIIYAFDAFKEDTVTNLAVDFIKESFSDFVEFISEVINN